MSSVLKLLYVMILLSSGAVQSSPEVGLLTGALNQCFVDNFLNARNIAPNVRLWTEQRHESHTENTAIRTMTLAHHSLVLVCRHDSRDTGYEGWEINELCSIQVDKTVLDRARHATVSIPINDPSEIAFIRRYLPKCLGSFTKALSMNFEDDGYSGGVFENRDFGFKCISSSNCSIALVLPGH